MPNIQKIINSKIHMMAERNIQKSFLHINVNKNTTSHVQFNKLVQLESKVITCDLKKRGADILIMFIFILTFFTLS